MKAPSRIDWPGGKDFAFTVFDDTDLATLENVAPVYGLLGELGFCTTRSVWPIRGAGTPHIGGLAFDDDAYRSWTLHLQAAGFGARLREDARDIVNECRAARSRTCHRHQTREVMGVPNVDRNRGGGHGPTPDPQDAGVASQPTDAISNRANA